MEDPPEDINSALESFREQWRAEVRAKQSQTKPRSDTPPQNTKTGQNNKTSSQQQKTSDKRKPPTSPTQLKSKVQVQVRAHVQPPPTAEASSPSSSSSKPRIAAVEDTPSSASAQTPLPTAAKPEKTRSAVELYEDAVEQETRGNLGESLKLYRTAFRLDPKVEQQYKSKHFAAAWAPQKKPSSAAAGSSAAGEKQQQPDRTATTSTSTSTTAATKPQSLNDLINSFAGLAIEPAAPPIEGMPPPPCPIAALPDEVLLHILQDVTVDDVGDFVRLSQVCKRLAFLVATEGRIWRRVCLGTEFGFLGMHRRFQTSLTWEPEKFVLEELGMLRLDGQSETTPLEQEQGEPAISWALLSSKYGGSWQTMFRSRPRIRFNGCYISTVNYIRAGQASANQVTWNSPVHICTYFRYLRFFRDGTCISLLTTAEPAEVVQHLTKESLQLHRQGASGHLPSIVMQNALKGRWRLGSAVSQLFDDASKAEGEGKQEEPPETEEDLFIETEGIGKYMYRLDLALKTAGKLAKNNKLAWKGHYSYNRLTDDLAEFPLKNDRPFIFSRVKRFA
ncbi:hypothetical protein MCOR27_003014 [Pyricularia oryzae]|uniref:F-box domain-containing protein n=2 Tax=Pyricularia TaxID=48558 RepID=A0ABQ8N2R6_PYRGI|nr:hypothetical protein MCOR01_005080 [Pyricularia oryzae]KAI6290138.1 hypothetical protein MCOR33_011490 [Pyricularia grisea]KAH9431841.1 hypothetical protein MCOR02_009111 [Pyricularia oryzae]KAI6251907.1 hypothetical protein MCOR19_011467 [Pyricularia oryzae]KAI6264261.1 hypothetical protein MCOR26_011469 [Pyricularia oryzae]